MHLIVKHSAHQEFVASSGPASENEDETETTIAGDEEVEALEAGRSGEKNEAMEIRRDVVQEEGRGGGLASDPEGGKTATREEATSATS